MRLPDARVRAPAGRHRALRQRHGRAAGDITIPPSSSKPPCRRCRHRLEALEKDHAELVAELRAKLLRPASRRAYEPPPHHEPPRPPARSSRRRRRVEPPLPNRRPSPIHAFAPLPPLDAFTPPRMALPSTFRPRRRSLRAGAGIRARIPGRCSPPQPQPENFLAQARRSARAASEKAESERSGRFAGFCWSQRHRPKARKSHARAISFPPPSR